MAINSDPLIRQAAAEDAQAISAVLVASITQLCSPDHQDLPAVIAAWTANKTPGHIADWISEGRVSLLLAVCEGAIAAVGGYTKDGEVALLYVDPGFRHQGVSTTLLKAIERQLADLGPDRAHLVSTRTAAEFYQSRGWRNDGQVQVAFGMPGQPMIKDLTA